MNNISDILKQYSKKLDRFDLELLIAHSIGKSREFVLSYPEFEFSQSQISNLNSQIRRRLNGEPISYITGHKEFYGLDFEVNKHTLIPRPETEQLVELAMDEVSKVKGQMSNVFVVDVGTGSGNIIISIAKNFESQRSHVKGQMFFTGIDISKEALKVARRNAKKHKLDKNIKFLHGDLLNPILKSKTQNLKADNLIILANLPYLSKDVYDSAPIDVKKFEPKSALYSPKKGLGHYEKLFKQIKKLLVTCHLSHVTCYLEFSPEQKSSLQNLIKEHLPTSKTEFQKDLAGKWRIAKISLI